MKRILNNVIYPVLFTVLILTVALLLFLLLAKFEILFLLQQIVVGEKTLFLFWMRDTQNIFHHAYIVHAVLFYVLATLGMVCIFRVSIRSLKPLWIKAQPFIAKEKSLFTKLLFFICFVLVIVGLLLIKENQFVKQGYFPGSYFKGVDFAKTNPLITHELIADETGMTFYDYDSFPNSKFPIEFMVNKQGFPNAFNFDRKTVDSLSELDTSRKKKILFVGDSFLEGLGASRFSKCFIEIYRKENTNLVVCAAGIHGSDPVQYRQFAQKFIPELKPDEVCVLFCGWNDIMNEDREPLAYIPQYTDIPGVGVINNYLPAALTGKPNIAFPPEKTYRIYRKYYSLFEKGDVWAKLAQQSCVTTQLYFNAFPAVNYTIIPTQDSLATYRSLQKIKALADSAGANFSIVFIPTPEMKNFETREYEQNYRWVFKDLWAYVHFPPQGLITEQDCSSAVDYHFNDGGQIKFAKFLDATMQTKAKTNANE